MQGVCTGVLSTCSWQARAFWTRACVMFKSCLFCAFDPATYYVSWEVYLLSEKLACVVALPKLLGQARKPGYSDRAGVCW